MTDGTGAAMGDQPTADVRSRLLDTAFPQPTAEADLVSALGALADPPKEGKVAAGQRRYQYLTLVDLLGAVRPVFAAHNLAVMQYVETGDGLVSLVTRLVHSSGHVFESPSLVLTCQRDAQSVGSAITYARRYQLGAMVGLAGEDDDGQAAQQPRGNAAEFNQTRPVTRAPKRADDPQDAPYQTPPTPPPAMRPPAAPVDQGEMGDLGSPSTTTLASKKSTTMMWALKRESPMTDAEFRTWVAQLFSFDSEDWHTADLTQAQVSAVIRRLQAAPSVGPDRPRAGQ